MKEIIDSKLVEINEINGFYLYSQSDDLFVYYIDFQNDDLDGIYDCSIDDNGNVVYLRHIR